MAGKGGGAWKVAYADFVTAMMAFFMVMWLTSQNDSVKEAVAHTFQDPFAVYVPQDGANSNRPKPGPTTNAPVPKQVDDKDKKARRTRRPTLLVSGDGTQTRIGVIVPFAPHSAELDEAARQALDRLLPTIQGKPQKIEIRGHASRRPLAADSPHADPWALAYARCQSVRAFLEEHDIAPERIRLSQGGVHEPLDSAQSLDDQERVEVNLLNEMTASHPAAVADEPPTSPVNVSTASPSAAH
jgi:chemotaxis protein MotB